MDETKPNQKEKLTLSAARLKPLIPTDCTGVKLEDYIVEALEYYRRYRQREQVER